MRDTADTEHEDLEVEQVKGDAMAANCFEFDVSLGALSGCIVFSIFSNLFY
jgi:hypothetical protein